MVTYGHSLVPGDLFDDVKAGAANVATAVRRDLAAKTVIALGVFYALVRGQRWR